MTDGHNVNSCDVSIDTFGATVNGSHVQAAEPVATFYSLLGDPTRVVANVHYYDHIGVTLLEHHYTYQINQITFVLNTKDAIHPTTQPFAGELELGGVNLSPGDVEAVLADCKLGFTSQLTGTWFAEILSSQADGHRISVAIDTKGRRLPSGGRSKKREILTVSLCLEHDPWDKRYRPK